MAAIMRATHQVGYIVQKLTVKNSAIGMQCEKRVTIRVILKGHHNNNNTTFTVTIIQLLLLCNLSFDGKFCLRDGRNAAFV